MLYPSLNLCHTRREFYAQGPGCRFSSSRWIVRMRLIESHTKTSFLRFLLLLSPCLLPAAGRAEQLPIKTYTIAEGLARDTVNRIIQDPQGFLWFCTTEGLSRFDGYKFTTYRTDQGLPHFIVNDLLRTRNGLYWTATGSGVRL